MMSLLAIKPSSASLQAAAAYGVASLSLVMPIRSQSHLPARVSRKANRAVSLLISGQHVGNRRVYVRAGDGQPMAIRSVPVQVAKELLEAGHTYLDVRTEEEFTAGHVEGAVNIPFMFKTPDGMVKNTDFVKQVSGKFAVEDELIIGCKSGRRSMAAAADLQAAGLVCVTDLSGGYDAWRASHAAMSEA